MGIGPDPFRGSLCSSHQPIRQRIVSRYGAMLKKICYGLEKGVGRDGRHYKIEKRGPSLGTKVSHSGDR